MTARTVHLGFGLTADEFIDLNDETSELINGEMRPKPVPGFEHTEFCVYLASILLAILGRRRVLAEQDVRMSELDVLRPDVCVSASTTPKLRKGALTEPPLLCVEILSPSQRMGELFVKCERYHEFGVPFCWTIDPVARRAWEYQRGSAPLEKTDALTAGDLKIEIPVLFAD
jgi:Uma2 family endonuclease